MNSRPSSIGILAASGRAIAQSAQRAGLPTLVFDLFADWDTQAVAPSVLVKDFPDGFANLLKDHDPCRLIYTGGLENSPDVIRSIQDRHQLIGNSADVLDQLLDHQQVAEIVQACQVSCPETKPLSVPFDTSRKYILKKRRASGGLGIRVDAEKSRQLISDEADVTTDWVRQEWIEGESISLVFCRVAGPAQGLLASQSPGGESEGNEKLGDSAEVQWVGATRQFNGDARFHTPPFLYSGSMTDVYFSHEQLSHLQRLGNRLADHFQLQGFFNIDLVHRRSSNTTAGEFYFLELNPRLSSSVEILERAFGFNSVECQIAACNGIRLNEFENPSDGVTMGQPIFAKAVQYAPAKVRPKPGLYLELQSRQRNRTSLEYEIADVPAPGTMIEKGSPLFTVFAMADDREHVETELLTRASYWLTHFETV